MTDQLYVDLGYSDTRYTADVVGTTKAFVDTGYVYAGYADETSGNTKAFVDSGYVYAGYADESSGGFIVDFRIALVVTSTLLEFEHSAFMVVGSSLLATKATKIKQLTSNMSVEVNQTANTRRRRRSASPMVAFASSLVVGDKLFKQIFTSAYSYTNTGMIQGSASAVVYKPYLGITKEFSAVLEALTDSTSITTKINSASSHLLIDTIELVAIGKIGAFFINSEVNTTMRCHAHITASGNSSMVVDGILTSKAEKLSDNKSMLGVYVSGTWHNGRIRNVASDMVLDGRVNTTISKVSNNHSQMLVDIAQISNGIRHMVGQSSMLVQTGVIARVGTRVTLGSALVSSFGTTAVTSRLRGSLMDITVVPTGTFNVIRLPHIQVDPMVTTTDFIATGRLFYLNITYGWVITPENRVINIAPEDRNYLLGYEDRTFIVGN